MIVRTRLWTAARRTCIPSTPRRCISASALEQRLSEPVQSYSSTSRDPYVNLSIEHYLLQHSAPDSAILFLYINRPSIIIGRNQNPWLEVNLALLNQSNEGLKTEPPAIGPVDLVRRRSGGGTVFHDEGNVNWTVICPSAKFTRDKHAEMVVRGLREIGVDRARVNERHDIVLDQGERRGEADPSDTHVTPYTSRDNDGPRPLKVSGSAYKLTRNRALHHGTCLLSSPNLHAIPHFLHSPAKPYIKARGVESVSSPVANILRHADEFQAAVQANFSKFYSESKSITAENVGDDMLEINAVKAGHDELKSLEWTFLQTPQFTVSNATDTLAALNLDMNVRHGAILDATIAKRVVGESNEALIELDERVIGTQIHKVGSWEDVLKPSMSSLNAKQSKHIVNWLEQTLPTYK